MSVLLLAQSAVSAPGCDRFLYKTVTVQAPVDAVWQAWTTEHGITGFFARGAAIDLRVGGRYDILFAPQAEPGQRGAEGVNLLAVEPQKRLAFTWNAPPVWPRVRAQRTFVDLRLKPVGPMETTVELRHSGWGEGQDWDEVFEYFDGAWDVVLDRLQYRFEQGRIDWDHLPQRYRYSPASSEQG